MKKLLQTAALCLGLAAGLVQTALAQEQVEIGTQIYPKTGDAAIRVNNQVIGTAADISLPLKVRKVNGEWLWIWVHEKKTEGWIHRSNVCTAREAVSYFTQQIAVNSNVDHNYFCRSTAYEELGQLDRSLDDETQRIRLNPKSGSAYNGRGMVWATKKEFDIAIADYTEAIRLDPKNAAPAYNNRGNAYRAKKYYSQAIADYTESIRLDPKYALPFNNTAWLRATCPDSRFRNGRQAVEFATKACELERWKNTNYLDTLAAAYAEAGQFSQAVKYQEQAVELVDVDKKADFQSRVALYRSGKPYREPPKGSVPTSTTAAVAPPPVP